MRFGQILLSLARIGLASLLMGLACWGMMSWLGLETMANGWVKIGLTLGSIAAGVAVFAVAASMLRCKELSELLSMLRRDKAKPGAGEPAE